MSKGSSTVPDTYIEKCGVITKRIWSWNLPPSSSPNLNELVQSWFIPPVVNCTVEEVKISFYIPTGPSGGNTKVKFRIYMNSDDQKDILLDTGDISVSRDKDVYTAIVSPHLTVFSEIVHLGIVRIAPENSEYTHDVYITGMLVIVRC
jgi:hypothetical protein